MADKNNQERSQAADAQVSSAAKTGKTISKIAVGAATGGIHGAVLATAKASKNGWELLLVSFCSQFFWL